MLLTFYGESSLGFLFLGWLLRLEWVSKESKDGKIKKKNGPG